MLLYLVYERTFYAASLGHFVYDSNKFLVYKE